MVIGLVDRDDGRSDFDPTWARFKATISQLLDENTLKKFTTTELYETLIYNYVLRGLSLMLMEM